MKKTQEVRGKLERTLPSLQPRNTSVTHENDIKGINVILGKGSCSSQRHNEIPYLPKQMLLAERHVNSFSKSETKTYDCVDLWKKPHQSFMKNEGIAKSISILLMWSVKMLDI